MITLTASDFYSYYSPSECDLRVYLRHKREKEAPPSPYEETLMRLGELHEKKHLATLGSFVDISHGINEERMRRTYDSVIKKKPVVYHALLSATLQFTKSDCVILGEPDFMILEENSYIIRDSKISKRITEKDHPEIMHQLNIYGWLYEQIFKKPPAKLQVHSGPGDIIAVPYDNGGDALKMLEQILALKLKKSEPYTPVGWSKCGSCGFSERCWDSAVKRNDIAIVSGVDQGLAIALHKEDIDSITDLLEKFDEKSLSSFQRPWGQQTRAVGGNAKSIIDMAKAMETKKEILLQKPNIPHHASYVMFDIEGMPPHLDELEKIYLWGLQVFGEDQSEYKSAAAGFNTEGDRKAWFDFLELAGDIFNHYGDIPFVHWHVYEKTYITKYAKKYGDRKDVVSRIQKNLFDLLPVVKKSIALPLPSYSLKVVEQHVGFKRTLKEYGGDWAMAKYIEATEIGDEKEQAKIIDQIRAYNREDLEATWAVLSWIKSKIK